MKARLPLACAILALSMTSAQGSPKAPAAASKVAKPVTAQQACADPHIQCLDKPILVSLHMPDGSTFAETLPAPNPLLQYGHIYLFPGQTLDIEADVDGDKLVKLRMVPVNVHPEKTLVFSFHQSTTPGQYGMLLSIHNPFTHYLKYHALIVDADTKSGTFRQSTTCPVIPGSNASENWIQPVLQLVLSDFHFLSQGSREKGHCIY